jgi:signal transduction histidine kinase
LLPGRTDDWRLVVNIRDITARALMEDALAEANRELEILARTVTHDVMAPLSAMNLAGERLDEYLRSGIGEEDLALVGEVVNTIREGVVDAIGLTTDIASLLQIGNRPGAIERVEVPNVVNRVVAQLSPGIEAKGFDVQVDEDMDSVIANPTHVYQLFVNLMSNAVKYNDNSNPVIRVSRLESKTEDEHRYVVRDNGPGIPLEQVDRVFQPFFRGETGGSGLGLATVQKVVKLYGGDITDYNDGGACFEFTLRDASRGSRGG